MLDQSSRPLGPVGRLMARLRAQWGGRPLYRDMIRHDSDGFAIIRCSVDRLPAHLGQARWLDVRSAVAHKADCLVHDLVCMTFIQHNGSEATITDGAEGWDSLLSSLPTYLPGCEAKEAWWQSVVLPTFAAKPTIIFRR